jgi:DNA replication protein DnaC
MAESTTMDDMTGPSAVRMGDTDTVRALQERLAERGWDGTVTEPDNTPERETPEEAAERRARRMEGLTARYRTRVPDMYQDANLDDLDDRQDPIVIRSWLASGSLHLVLAGPVGTGKTFAAYAVTNQAVERGHWVEVWTVGDLMDALRPGANSQALVAARVRGCQVLLLDDLPAKATDWETERLTLMVDARVREGLRTIITTNITSDQITSVWGARLMDRLRYRLTVVTLTGESRRAGAW